MVKPIISKGLGWKFNTRAMLGATAAFGGAMAADVLNPAVGTGMLGLLGLYMVGNYLSSKKDAAAGYFINDIGEDHHDLDKASKRFNVLWGLTGVGGLLFSSKYLIDSASTFADNVGIDPAIIGLFALSIGTSLPELAVNIKAAMKDKTDMAVGNILGSNIFNILMVGGALALANTKVPEAFRPETTLGALNTATMVGSAAALAATLFLTKGKLKRSWGLAALGLYGAFTAANFYNNTGNQEDDNTVTEQHNQSIEVIEPEINSPIIPIEYSPELRPN
jgi:cation:H+ antiporter